MMGPMGVGFSIPPRVRPAVERFATVVCPPALVSEGRLGDLMVEVEGYMNAMPTYLRGALVAAFAAFDQAARASGHGRGRRFAALDDRSAEGYFLSWAHSRLAPRRNAAKLLKALVTFNYYELPAVKREIGFDPEPYVAEVSRRRLDRYRDEIEAGEAAVFE